MNAHVLGNSLAVQRRTQIMIKKANVALARALETFDNWLDVFDKEGNSEQALKFENLLANPDRTKKPSPKYMEMFSSNSTVNKISKERSDNSCQKLVLSLLRNALEKKMGRRSQSKEATSEPCKAGHDTPTFLPSPRVTTKDKTVLNKYKTSSAPHSRTIKSRVDMVTKKPGSFPSSPSTARKLAKSKISSSSRWIPPRENQQQVQHSMKEHSSLSFFQRKAEDRRKRLRPICSIDLTQSPVRNFKRRKAPFKSKTRGPNFKLTAKANKSKSITVIKNKQYSHNSNPRQTNPTTYLPSKANRKNATSSGFSSSGIIQPSQTLTPSKIRCSSDELLSPTTRMLKSLDQNNSDDSGMFSAKTTFMDLIAPKAEPAPAKPVIPALVTAMKAKKREEKRRLAKEKKTKHLGKKLSEESTCTQPSRQRPRIDGGWRTPNRTEMKDRHVAAQERRKRIQEEKKSQRLKSQQEKERRRKAAMKLKNSDMRSAIKKSRLDCFKKPKPKLRRKIKGNGSSKGRKPVRNDQQFKFDNPICVADVDNAKLFSGVKSYIMSEPDDSDSNMSGDDSDHPGDKKIPVWARKGVYSQLVGAQKSVDPDTIFGQYINQTIDLAQLYKRLPTKKRYIKRNPSGNWSLDKLTSEENAKYKTENGWGCRQFRSEIAAS